MAEEEKEVEEPTKDKSLVVQDEERRLLFEQLKEQYDLSWEDQQKLIRSQDPLTPVMVKRALQVAKQFGLPLQGINVIRDQVYVNADGLRWRIHTDPRKVKKSSADIIHRPSKEEPWIEARAVIIMGDDSEYVNYGVVNCSPSGDVGNSAMKAITKGKRRASVDAVGVALPIAEDFLEWQDEQRQSKGPTIEGAFREVPLTTTEPTNLAELLAWAGKCGKTMDDATAVVGDIMQITDFSAAVKKLREMWRL